MSQPGQGTYGGQPPDRIGRYEIRAVLGSGGFAVVYEAFDPSLDALVALKLFDTNSAEAALARERFVTEAQLLRRVDNPHVVTVFDVGEHVDGRPYFVMEYAANGALSHRIPGQAGQADADSLRSIIKGLAIGLTALHEAGVVHRDIKPDNLLITGGDQRGGEQRAGDTLIGAGILRGAERIVVGDLGLAKDTGRSSPEASILGGTPSFRAPEQMTIGAAITPAADVYGATGVLWNLLTSTEPPDAAGLDLQLATAPAEWRALLSRGLDPNPAKRHATIDDWARQCLAIVGDTTSTLGFRSAAPADVCPYKGLAAFQADDASLFFGRERLVDELAHRLQNNAALVVGGPSGSGKSSLVRAGLLPALERGVLPGAQNWRVALCTPGTDALFELAFHLRRLTNDDTVSADQLTNDAHAVRRSLSTDGHVLIAIDQFEELFTLNSVEVQQSLIDALEVLTSGSHSSIHVVLVVRADFYDRCAQFSWLAERINENQVLVGPMGSAELRRAIEGPALQTGLQIEPALVDEILDDAGANAGSLPLLAHALMETWIRRQGNQLTVTGYHEAGGVAGAIAQRAEETYASLSEPNKARARDLVLQMTSPGDNGPDTRRVVAWDQIVELEANQPVIDTFVEARLVTSTAHHIELAHETLLRSWPRAIEWIDDARDDLRARQRVATGALDWQNGEHNDDFLLRGSRLESTLEWSAEQSTPLPPLSQRFVDASQEARDAATAAANRERTRRRRNRRIAFLALAGLLAAAVVASLSARRNEQLANQATDDARQQVTLGLAATAEAQARTDPLFALALANESAARIDLPAAQSLGAMSTARTALAEQTNSLVPLSDAIPVGNVLQLDLTGDGRLLVLGDRSGQVTFMDVASRQVLQTDNTHSKGVESIHVNDDLNLAVTGGADGQILLWDLTTQPYVPEVLDTIEGLAVWSAVISPNGTRLSAITSDAGVTFYDLVTRSRIATRVDSAIERDALRSAFTADGSELLVGNSNGELIRVNVESGLPIEALAPHKNSIWDIDLSADGEYMYSASIDGTIRRVVLDTMTVDEGFRIGMTDTVIEMRGVEALADGRRIIAGASDGHIQLWDVTTGELISRSAAAHEDRVIDGAASADGTLYVSLSDDQKIRFWDVATRTPAIGAQIVQQEDALQGLALGPNGITAAGTVAGQVLLGTTSRPGVSQRIDVGQGEIFGLAFTKLGLLAVGDGNGDLSLWDTTTEDRQAQAARFHDGRILDIVISPDGESLVTAGSDGRIGHWDTDTLTLRNSIADLGFEVNGLAFTEEAELIAVDLSGRISFFSLDGRQTRTPIDAGEDALFAVAVSPTTNHIAVAGGNEAIAVFDLDSGEKVSRLTPLAGAGVDLAFTKSGAVVGLSRRGSIALWDPLTGDQLGPIMRVHTDGVDAWRLQLDTERGIWTTGGVRTAGDGGELHRLDVLDSSIACVLTSGVLDEQRRIKFLADEEPTACQPG